MKIDGVRGAPVTRVALDEFFERPTHVDIKPISPYGRALVKEILMESFEVGEMDAKSKTADVKTNTKGSADRDLRMREVKLRYTFVATDMQSEGQPVTWDKPLWDALDEMDPRIIDKVIDAVDSQSKFTSGDDTDPT